MVTVGLASAHLSRHWHPCTKRRDKGRGIRDECRLVAAEADARDGSPYNRRMSAPTFPKHDPADAQFWNLRFDAAFTPWDQGGVPQSLQQWVARQAGEAPTVLIPGCGSAYEVRFFAERGWPVSAIDFSPAAVAQAQRILGPLAGHVHQADFFDGALPGAPFDLVYERAFLCALPRRLWPQWAARVASLIKPGGRLAGFFFGDAGEKGPPFGLHAGELEAMLAPNFRQEETQVPTDSIPVFAGKESWQVWVRKSGSPQ